MAQDGSLPTGAVERQATAEKEMGLAKYWLMEIQLGSKEEKKWRDEGKKVIERYQDEADAESTGSNSRSTFNILYSNTETLKPALYNKTPLPDVRRRFMEKDPIGRTASMILERALSYTMDQPGGEYDFDAEVQGAIDDQLLPGRGVLWVMYEPVIVEQEAEEYGADGTAQSVMQETVADQRVWCERVNWEDFGFTPAKTWREVRAVWRCHYMSRDDLVSRFGEEVGGAVPLNWVPTGIDQNDDNADAFKRAKVYEVWDKTTRRRLFVTEGYEKPISVEDDPLNLQGFFPTPRPLYAITTRNSLVPIPLYRMYRTQAQELDKITTRIMKLVDALKRRGVYDAAMKELADLAEAGDNVFLPVAAWESVKQKGGLQSVMESEDISMVAGVLGGLYQQREQIKAVIYEVIGLGDILRGQGNPNETATAQRIKGQWGGMRVQTRQDEVARFIRDTLRITSEIIAEHFEPEILLEMTGMRAEVDKLSQQMTAQRRNEAGQQAMQMLASQGMPQEQAQQYAKMAASQVPPVDAMAQIMELLRSDKMRGFRIDIETDSTIMADATAERAEYVELLGGVTQMLSTASSVPPEALPFIGGLFSEVFRRFKVGRKLEDQLDEMIENMAKPKQPKPSPEQIKAQTELQKAQIKAKSDQQSDQIDAQTKIQTAEIDAQAEIMVEQVKQKGETIRDSMRPPEGVTLQ